MKANFNFKSAICTDRFQSERLLALGLKKETADMVLLKEMVYDEQEHCLKDGEGYIIRPIDYLEGEEHRGHIPAWSLHRLIEMIQDAIVNKNGNDDNLMLDISGIGLYDGTIDGIAELIKVGYFPKEYLV